MYQQDQTTDATRRSTRVQVARADRPVSRRGAARIDAVRDPRDEPLLDRVQTVVERHIANSVFGVEWLASDVFLSTRQLQRRMRAATGMSAAGYIRTCRMKHAARMLVQQRCTVAHASVAAGFRDPRHFSRLFKRTFGESPSTYRATRRRGHIVG